jgi:hypothetical protein
MVFDGFRHETGHGAAHARDPDHDSIPPYPIELKEICGESKGELAHLMLI